MIKLTRLNKKEFILNAELIKFVEETPDTIITLTTGEKVVVRDELKAVIEQTIMYKRQIHTAI